MYFGFGSARKAEEAYKLARLDSSEALVVECGAAPLNTTIARHKLTVVKTGFLAELWLVTSENDCKAMREMSKEEREKNQNESLMALIKTEQDRSLAGTEEAQAKAKEAKARAKAAEDINHPLPEE